jgi:hypothetical protein
VISLPIGASVQTPLTYAIAPVVPINESALIFIFALLTTFMYTDARELHPANAYDPIVWTLAGIITLVRSEQTENALIGMFRRFVGSITETNPEL